MKHNKKDLKAAIETLIHKLNYVNYCYGAECELAALRKGTLGTEPKIKKYLLRKSALMYGVEKLIDRL